MEPTKKKAIILVGVCLVILVGAFIANYFLNKKSGYLTEISYNKLMEKIENKEDLVLLISRTTCTHCISYKPKLEEVANNYKLVVYYMDIDLLDEKDEKKIEEMFSINGTPTTIFLIAGEEKTSATRIVGDAKEEKIITKLKSNGFIE